MPLALPLIAVGVVLVAIVGLGYIAVQNYQWSLSAPTGNTTLDNIVRWIDANIRAVVDWSFGGIKRGVNEILNGIGLTYDSLSVLVQFVLSLPAKSQTVAKMLIASAILSSTKSIQKLFDGLQSSVNNVLKTDIARLKSDIAALTTYAYKTLSASITLTNVGLKSVQAWITGEFERRIKTVISSVSSITVLVNHTITDLTSLKSLVTGTIMQKLTVDIPNQIIGVVSRVVALEKFVTTALSPMFFQFNDWKNWLKELVEALKETLAETADAALESDAAELLAQYGWLAGEITKVYADVAPELLRALKEGYSVG